MKERLVILSDLWGARDDAYLKAYHELLRDTFDVIQYDSSQLAQIPSSFTEQEQIHQAFVNGGIQTAVQTLAKLEPGSRIWLGISVGGVLAWHHALQHPSVKELFAISATRLRYESNKPDCKIQLHYGALDDYRPNQDWIDRMHISTDVHIDEGHQLYKQQAFIRHICKAIRQIS